VAIKGIKETVSHLHMHPTYTHHGSGPILVRSHF
jgi:hypothetical protein